MPQKITLRDLTVEVPLTADPSDARTLTVFARVVTPAGGEHLPYLLFLQGGPGFESPRPTLAPNEPSWLPVALERYQVVFLDQRGTGRSTPVTDALLGGGDGDHDTGSGTAPGSAPDAGASPEATAEYLTHFRAPDIVRDAEAVREALGTRTWSTLGQSFGGFVTLSYLTLAPDSLDRVFFTGGLPGVDHSIDETYALTYAHLRRRNEWWYARFPETRATVAALMDRAAAGRIVLPTGEVVSPSRLRSLGHLLGSDHGWARLRALLDHDPAANAFRYDLADLLPYSGRNPLYYVLHESCWANGTITDWAAQRARPADFRDDLTLLTGEHVDPDWLQTVPGFQPWADISRILARHRWDALYERHALSNVDTAGAAAIYVDDVFVPVEGSRATAALLPNVRTHITDEYAHSGLRTSGGDILRTLFSLADTE